MTSIRVPVLVLLVAGALLSQGNQPEVTISAPKLPDYADWLYNPAVPSALRHQLIPLYIEMDASLQFLNANKWPYLQTVVQGLWSGSNNILRSSTARVGRELAGIYTGYPMGTSAAGKLQDSNISGYTDEVARAITNLDRVTQDIWAARKAAGWEATIGPEPKKLTREYLVSPESMMKYLDRTSKAGSGQFTASPTAQGKSIEEGDTATFDPNNLSAAERDGWLRNQEANRPASVERRSLQELLEDLRRDDAQADEQLKDAQENLSLLQGGSPRNYFCTYGPCTLEEWMAESGVTERKKVSGSCEFTGGGLAGILEALMCNLDRQMAEALEGTGSGAASGPEVTPSPEDVARRKRLEELRRQKAAADEALKEAERQRRSVKQ